MGNFYVEFKSEIKKISGRHIFESFEDAIEFYLHTVKGHKKICPELKYTFTFGEIVDKEISKSNGFDENSQNKNLIYKCIKCTFVGTNKKYIETDVDGCTIVGCGNHLAYKCPNCGEIYDVMNDVREEIKNDD